MPECWVTRQAARLIVLDGRGRVQLVQYEDHRGKWWATPGGGLQETETFEEAAVREAEEELGIVQADIEPLWERITEFPSRDGMVRQRERYFRLNVSNVDTPVDDAVIEAQRAEGILATRWWSIAEIERSTQAVFPEDIVERLRHCCPDVAN